MESGFVPLFLWVHVPECIHDPLCSLALVASPLHSPPPYTTAPRNLLQLPRHILLLLISHLQSWRWTSITFVQKTFLLYSSREALAQSSKARSSPFLGEVLAGVPSPWNERLLFLHPLGCEFLLEYLSPRCLVSWGFFYLHSLLTEAKWDGIQGNQWKSLMESLHTQSYTIS